MQFHETDAAGIVHFSRYILYMEEAEHALWREAGLSIAPRDSPIGWPRQTVWPTWVTPRQSRFSTKMPSWGARTSSACSASAACEIFSSALRRSHSASCHWCCDGGVITLAHVQHAVRREMQKLGQRMSELE